MRGDLVYRVYGVHKGRAEDCGFGAFRTRSEAEAKIAELATRDMDGKNWAARYHNLGFVVREHAVDNDFEWPSRPKPRDRYAVRTAPKANRPGTWSSTIVDVFARREDGSLEPERRCSYERNYAMLQTFEPFRQGTRELALVSRDYTLTAVLDLATGEVIAEEAEDVTGGGFCPVGFYVPDWWDVHDGSLIPGSEHWDANCESPVGDFGFVWGCFWGDDSSWKVQYLDLRRVQEGVILRDDRFGYVELATGDHVSRCISPEGSSRPPPFIRLSRYEKTSVHFAVELQFNLASGAIDPDEHAALVRPTSTTPGPVE